MLFAKRHKLNTSDLWILQVAFVVGNIFHCEGSLLYTT
jgi:hypothetical protein